MNKIKAVFKSISKIVFVKRCVACRELLPFDHEGDLCDKCAVEWDEAKRTVCPHCYDMQSRCRCGFGKKQVDSVRHLALYSHTERDTVANRLVYALKKSNRSDVFDFVAREMVNELIYKRREKNTVVMSVPRNPESVRRYGYDHAKKLGKRVAELLDIGYIDALGHRGGKNEQKQLNKYQREQNAKSNCFVKEKVILKIKGMHVILVDDIGTTGAMTGACAELLKKNGALSVDCVLCAKNK